MKMLISTRARISIGAAISTVFLGLGVPAASASGAGGYFADNGYPVFSGPQAYFPEIEKTNHAHAICIYGTNQYGWTHLKDLTNGLVGYTPVNHVRYTNPYWSCN
jgi:hypothetical protein